MILKNNASKDEFKLLVYPHMKLVYNVALKYCGNVFDAEDIVQETYLMAYDKFHQLREKSKCKPWLLTILRNNFLKTYHKKKSQLRLTESDYIDFLKESLVKDDAERILSKGSFKIAVKNAIDKLPPKYKEVLTLYYMDEMLYRDIAQVLDIPIGTVMSRLTRAREGLKTIILKQTRNNMNPNILNMNFNQTIHAKAK